MQTGVKMHSDIEAIVLGSMFFDERGEFVDIAGIQDNLFTNKDLFKKVYEWRKDNKPYDMILAAAHFTADEMEILNSGIDRMVHIANYPYYLALFKRKVLESRITEQIARQEVDIETIRQYVDAVNGGACGNRPYDYSGDLMDYMERFGDRITGSYERYSLNMRGIDDVLGYVRPKMYYTVGANSGVGKTNLMLEIMLKQMKKDVPCLFLTAEMPYDSLVERMGSINSGLRLFDITNAHLNPEHLTRYIDTLKDTLYDKKSYVLEVPKFNVPKLKETIDKTKTKFIFVDYLQKFDLTPKRGETRASAMSDIVNGLKEIAMEKSVVVFGGCQLAAHADRANPKTSDLKESGGILEASDAVILMGEIAEDTQFKKLKIDVAKNKYGITDKFVYKMNRKSCAMEYSAIDTDILKG